VNVKKGKKSPSLNTNIMILIIFLTLALFDIVSDWYLSRTLKTSTLQFF
jgi:hypothetical protein